MATTIVPIATSLLGALGPLVGDVASDLLSALQKHIPQGDTAIAHVVAALKAFLGSLAGAGAIQQTPPTDAQLQAIVDGVLATLKADGLIPASPAPTPNIPAPGRVPAGGSAAALLQWLLDNKRVS
jgi:hypothetical protein